MSLSTTSVQAAFQVIDRHQRILVVPHANVDPDGLSAALACFAVFSQLGKDVTVICPDTLPESLHFLPGYEKLKHEIQEHADFVITINMEEGMEIDTLRYSVEDHRVNIIVVPKNGSIRSPQVHLHEGDPPYDLIVTVDTADLTLLGSFYREHSDLFGSVPILNVDHHISNTRFGHVHLIDPTAASATEVLYSWFLQIPSMLAFNPPSSSSVNKMYTSASGMVEINSSRIPAVSLLVASISNRSSVPIADQTMRAAGSI